MVYRLGWVSQLVSNTTGLVSCGMGIRILSHLQGGTESMPTASWELLIQSRGRVRMLAIPTALS